MDASRRYGYFQCPECDKEWESSHVYCHKGTNNPIYEQDCKECDTACFPYHVEKIRCSVCGKEDCCCTKEERQKKRHIDPNKPHLSHLCHKCRAGKPCT